MAKIVEEMFVVKVSRLVKNSSDVEGNLVTEEVVSTVETLVDELLSEIHNSDFVVEVIKE